RRVGHCVILAYRRPTLPTSRTGKRSAKSASLSMVSRPAAGFPQRLSEPADARPPPGAEAEAMPPFPDGMPTKRFAVVNVALIGGDVEDDVGLAPARHDRDDDRLA